LAFIHVAGAAQQIFTINADGTGLKQLTHSTTLKGALAWSPNGKRIAFTAGSEENSNIWVIRANGTDAHPLAGGTSLGNEGSPSWQRR